jgi:hypothetical protein
MNNYGLSASTFVERNPFGNVRSITRSHPTPYKMLYQNVLIDVQAHIVKMHNERGVNVIKSMLVAWILYNSRSHLNVLFKT